MVKIHIDIKTRILPDDHKLYIVRPGSSYRLYQDVVEQSAILYELPGLELPAGVPFDEIEDIDARILRSQAIRDWYRIGRHTGREFPSRDLAAYPRPQRSSERRSLSQLRSIGRGYFSRARTGDLIVVPPLRFAEPVMVGEIVEDGYFETSVPFFGNERLYGRRVRWLTGITKNDVPSRVIEISQKPNSFVQLERSSAIWFYDRTYRSYYLSGRYQCELKIGAEEFGSSDDARLSAFLNFVVANYAALTEGQKKPLEVLEAVLADLGRYEPDKRASINSPGEIVIHAARISPILFMVLMALAGCAPAEVVGAVTDSTITIGNTAGGVDDPCAAEVYKSTIEWLKFVGVEMWEKACPIAAQATESANITSPATVTIDR